MSDPLAAAIGNHEQAGANVDDALDHDQKGHEHEHDESSTLMAAAAIVAMPPDEEVNNLLLEEPSPAPAPAVAATGADGTTIPAAAHVFWEAPLFARVESVQPDGKPAPPPDKCKVSTENILAWCQPQYKGLNIYFSSEYKPSDDTGFTRLKHDLQASAAAQGFSLVSKGSKRKPTAVGTAENNSAAAAAAADNKIRHVFVCARGRVIPNSRRTDKGKGGIHSIRPTEASECCRFRLTVHENPQNDRFFVRGAQNNPQHKAHHRMDHNASASKRKRSRQSEPTAAPGAEVQVEVEAATNLLATSAGVDEPPSESNPPDTTITTTTAAAAASANNVVWHSTSLTRADRWKNHKGAVLWFTGLSGSGKSSVANEVEVLLSQRNIHTYLLDGDNVRHGLCSDLGFSAAARNENIRRTAEVAKLLADAGMVVLAAFVSPYVAHREKVRAIVTSDADIAFVEIYVKASLETCEGRDPKGLYLKARAGIISNFTGISDPYEEPEHPHILLNADLEPVPVLAQQVVRYLDFNGAIDTETDPGKS